MWIKFNKETEEFIAKIYCDLGKNIVSIGFASYFFKDLALPLRVLFAIFGIGLIVLSIFTVHKKGA